VPFLIMRFFPCNQSAIVPSINSAESGAAGKINLRCELCGLESRQRFAADVNSRYGNRLHFSGVFA
jgi:hypothetical protein